jgi:hypothetical protein
MCLKVSFKVSFNFRTRKLLSAKTQTQKDSTHIESLKATGLDRWRRIVTNNTQTLHILEHQSDECWTSDMFSKSPTLPWRSQVSGVTKFTSRGETCAEIR